MTYSVWQSFITDGGEQVVAAATVSVFLENSGAPATLYDGPAGSPVGSSVVSGLDGLARFFVAGGVYKIVASKGAFSKEFRHVQLGNSQSHDIGSGLDDVVIGSELLAKKDVLSFANFAAFPLTGAVKTIYIAEDTSLIYHWDGAAYDELGKTSCVFYADTYNTSGVKAVELAATPLPNGSVINVDRDETAGGVQTRRVVTSGVLGAAVNELDAGQVSATGGVTVQGKLDDLDEFFVKNEFISENLGIVAAGITERLAPDEVDPADVVATPSTANLADPDVTDAALPTIADQLHRVYNAGGSLSAQSPTTLGTFAVTKKYDIAASTAYTISMHGAPLDAQFYFNPVRLDFFDGAGTFVSSITSFTVNGGQTATGGMAKVRSIEFTSPAGISKVALNLRDPVNFSNTNPMTEEYLGTIIDNIMLNAGSVALPFVHYFDGTYSPTTAIFDTEAEGASIVAIQGEYTYIRSACQQSTDKDVVWRIRQNYDFNYARVDSRTGVVDFYGVRFIPKPTSVIGTVAAFNQSTEVQSNGADESCPEKFNSMFLGGGHGIVGYEVTKTSHGMANVDVGSIWSDGTNQWVLQSIISSNVLMFIRRYTGTLAVWRIGTNAPSSSTFTHVSGATTTGNIAFTSPTQKQFVPYFRDYVLELTLDGTALTTDGVYSGDRVVLSELYSLLNPASQQDSLIAAVGAADPDYLAADVTEQIRIFNEYSWNQWGAMTVRCGRGVKNAYDRVVGSKDYWGGIQLQRISLTGDSTPGNSSAVWLYVPNIAPVGGYDFEAIANITANAVDNYLPKASCDDPSDPASHFCMFGRTGSTVNHGHLFAYDRKQGVGIPANRAASVTNVHWVSAAEKQYPQAVDSTAGNALVGDVIVATAIRAPFLPTDSDLTIPAVIVTSGAKYYCYITVHQALVDKSVAVPSALNGLPISVLKADANVSVQSEYVGAGAIVISVAGSYGDVILEIG